jgi:hypothetical protein
MTRWAVLGIIVAALTLSLAVPALADPLPQGLPCTPTPNGNGAATCTVNAHQVTMTFFSGHCAPAALDAAAVFGNAVFHVMQIGAGHF